MRSQLSRELRKTESHPTATLTYYRQIAAAYNANWGHTWFGHCWVIDYLLEFYSSVSCLMREEVVCGAKPSLETQKYI